MIFSHDEVELWVQMWVKSFQSGVVDEKLLASIDLMDKPFASTASELIKQRYDDIPTPMETHKEVFQKKILVVDDDPDILGILKELIEEKGEVVYTANTLLEVSDILKNNRPDGMIVDLIMPTLGWSLTNNLKIPSVIYTGSPDMAKSVAQVPVVSKPSCVTVLLDTLYRQMAA